MIAGTLRGRTLYAPAGRTTRPTADRVRESLFALLGAIPEGARVLDLFAGSGALGIEALSRGAPHATFAESAPRARTALRRNLERLGLRSRARVVAGRGAIQRALALGPFDLVLADPPYGGEDLSALARSAAGALAPDGVLVLEHAVAEHVGEVPETLALWKARRYGGTALTLYVRREDVA